MDKKIINKILNAAIIFLCCIVALLGFLIYEKSQIVQIENVKDTFSDMQEETEEEEQTQKTENVVETVEEEKKKLAETTSRVNIRDIDSEDGKVLDTVEAGAQYEFVEIIDSGWTKIIYDGQDGYINSKYVKLIDAPTNAMDETDTETEIEQQETQISADQEQEQDAVVSEEQTTQALEEEKQQSTTSQEGDKQVIDASTIFH